MDNEGQYLRDDAENRRQWNSIHIDPDKVAQGALSGSDPEDVLGHHQLMSFIRPGLTVLDIGVGLGGMAKYLHSKGCVVDSMDVADKAEDTVRPYIRRFYLADDIFSLSSDTYDLALSQLVAQHMCERNLREQIKHVFRSLKSGGRFSLHLAGATEEPLNNLAGSIPPGMNGAMCRDPAYARNMVEDELKSNPYRIMMLDHRMEWPQFKSYWYFFHIFKE